MTTTETTQVPRVYQAISAVCEQINNQGGISKSRKNQQQGYAFRGIDEVYNALSPILARNKLCIIPVMLDRTCEERISGNNKALFYVNVRARFDFVSAEDGSKHEVFTFGEAMDSGDKATNKAMSAAYKYAAMMTFCIPTEGDNDSENHTHDVKPREAFDWKAWCQEYAEAIKNTATPVDLEKLVRERGLKMGELHDAHPTSHTKLSGLLEERRKELAPQYLAAE